RLAVPLPHELQLPVGAGQRRARRGAGGEPRRLHGPRGPRGAGPGAVRDAGRRGVQPRTAAAGDPTRGPGAAPAVVRHRGGRTRGHGRGRRLQLAVPAGLAPVQQAALRRRAGTGEARHLRPRSPPATRRGRIGPRPSSPPPLLPIGSASMTWYVLRRVLQMIPVFFGATLLVYFLVFFMPGDPIATLGGDK